VLAGSLAFIQQARRFRKALGGGMRQCGVLAAAADFALNGVKERIMQDHNNTRQIALGNIFLQILTVFYMNDCLLCSNQSEEKS